MVNSETLERMKSVKSRIEKLIEDGHLAEAKAALEKYEDKMPGDANICSMRAVIAIMEGSLDEAKLMIQEGLKKDSVYFDLLFNLAYIYEQQGQYQEAADLYNKTATVAYTDIQKQNVNVAIERIKAIDDNVILIDKAKIVFFVKEGMDNFLGDIINGLFEEYWTRKIIVEDFKQIDEGMKWADVCWFEWCDELVIYGSKLGLARERKLVCRLHSYEAFTDYVNKVVWGNIDKVIFVAEHIRDFILTKQPTLQLKQTVVIPNGLDVNKYLFRNRNHGFHVAYVGYINYKKGPMLLLHTFKALYDKDNRYKLFIAGKFQDFRDELYFTQMIAEFGIGNNVFFDGWQDNIDQWLEDKNYILCTSVLESQNISVMQAMCKGIKPIIHNFVGARGVYAQEYIWNTMDEAVKAIMKGQYESEKYRAFIKNHYSMEMQRNKIKSLVLELLSFRFVLEKAADFLEGNGKPEELLLDDLTVLIPCYNRAKMLKEDLDSGFKLGRQPKLIVDDYSIIEREWLEQIEKDFQKTSSRLIRNEKNSGVAESRRHGLEAIHTKYATFIDDDNMMFCLNKEKAIKDISSINNEVAIVVPRYIINYYSDRLSLGYDRYHYDGMTGVQALCDLAYSGEMMGLLTGGAIGDTKWMSEHSYCPMFQVSEDFIMLVRMMASKPEKKIRITKDLIFVRRFLDEGSTMNPTPVKLILSLFSQAIACYYCLALDAAKKDEILKWMKDRATLVQKLYNFGESFETELIAYLSGEISEEVFIHFLALNGLKFDNGLDELAPELPKMRALFYKEPDTKSLLADLKDFPLVSIIIPTFNRRDMLKRAIDQVLKQDYPNIEVIVTDNCSGDGTEEMVRSNYKDEKRLIYHKNKTNIGPAMNVRNAFYNFTNGKYCMVSCDDDYLINRSYISKAVEMFEKNPDIVYVYGGVYYNHMLDKKVYRVKSDMPSVVEGMDLFVNFTSQKYPYMPNGNTLIYRKENALKANILNGNPKQLAGDLFIQLRLLLTGDAGFVNNIVLAYTLHEGSISLNTSYSIVDENIDNNSKAVETAIVDINELNDIITLAKRTKNISSEDVNKWLTYRIWKYMYWRLNESARSVAECRALLKFLRDAFPSIYESLKVVAINRFGEHILDIPN